MILISKFTPLSLHFITLALLIPLAASFTANCVFESGSWVYAGSVYYCQLIGIKVETPDTWITGVDGTHYDGKSNNDVDAISIEYSPNCLFMPKGIEKFFSNVKALALTDSGLKAITADDLRPFPKLIDLQLYRNQLTTVGPGLLANNPKLINVYFHENRIRSISADLFDPIENLRHASFSENICINAEASTPEEFVALGKEVLEKCQNGFPSGYPGSSCQCNDQHLVEKMASLEACIASLQKKVGRLEANAHLSDRSRMDDKRPPTPRPATGTSFERT